MHVTYASACRPDIQNAKALRGMHRLEEDHPGRHCILRTLNRVQPTLAWDQAPYSLNGVNNWVTRQKKLASKMSQAEDWEGSLNLNQWYSQVVCKSRWEYFKVYLEKVNNAVYFFTWQQACNHTKLTDKYIAGRGRALKEFARRSLKAEVN